MVQYLQNNVIMKWTTCFIRFTGWIPLKYGSTITPPIIARCQKTSLYYKTRLIFETRRYIDTLDSRFIFYIDRQH